MTSSHISGTVAVANGSTTVTGTGSIWQTARLREGDLFCAKGLAIRIASITNNTTLVLAEPWPVASLVAGSSYEVRLVDDGVRQFSTLNEVLAKINITEESVAAATAALEGAETIIETIGDITEEAEGHRDAANASAAAAATSASTATTKASEAAASATAAATSATSADSSKTSASTSATNATTSATAAGTARTGAEAARDTAVTKAGEASTSATSAGTSATNAATAKTASETARDAAIAAKTSAETAATTATTKAGEASTSASNAASSKTSAETAATNAATAKTASETARDASIAAKDTAVTKAGEASTSATAATGSATAANTSKTSAETAATTATTKASEASGSATAATTKAGEASTSATAAAGSATTATTQAGIATTKAGEAATSASTATTKASEAASSAAAAAASAASIAGGAVTSLDGKTGVVFTDPAAVTSVAPTVDFNFTDINGASFSAHFTRSTTSYRKTQLGLYASVAINEPILDYDASGKPTGVSFWPAATNSIRNNSMQGAVPGVVGSGGSLPDNWGLFANSGLVTTVIGTGVDNGIDYIDLDISGTSSGTFYVMAFDTSPTASPGEVWTETIFAAARSGNSMANITSIVTDMRDNIGTTDVAFNTLTSTLTRQPPATHTILSGGTNAAPALAIFFASGSAISLKLRLGWPQGEKNGLATPPIRTTNAAVTKNLDSFVISGSDYTDVANNDEFTTFVDFTAARPVSPDTERNVLSVDDGSNSNRLIIRVNSDNHLYCYAVTGGVAQAALDLGTVTDGQACRVAFTAKANSFHASLNGGTVVSDTSGTMPTSLANIRLGRGATPAPLCAPIKRFIYWPKAMNTTEVQRIAA